MRQFIKDRITELGQSEFTDKWKEQIKKSKNHKELVEAIVD
ncbi:hypothetical protein OAD66_08110 [Bacteroidia bacterium]|nr:hypothetical protein [Bacteroidia bacterium]MDB9883078.1 hypothetical protein [Bacteroidia bacterium]